MEKWQINTTVISLILLHLGTASATGMVIYEYLNQINPSFVNALVCWDWDSQSIFTGPPKCWTVFDFSQFFFQLALNNELQA